MKHFVWTVVVSRLGRAVAVCFCAAVVFPALAVAGPARCPDVPAPIAKLQLERFYTDRIGSRSQPEIRTKNALKTAPLRRYLNDVAKAADRAVFFDDAGAAGCAIEALTDWAKAQSLTGPMGSKQGEHHRKWALAGLSMAYLKVVRWADPQSRQMIGGWLHQLADDSRSVFSNPKIKRNNHYYWLGLGLTSVGLSTQSQRHTDAGLKILERALDDIDDRGLLPLELARGRKALHYHVFAVTPIVLMNWLAAAHGHPVSKARLAALKRLIQQTLNGVSSPRLFEGYTGVQQDLPSGRANFAGYGWPQFLRSDQRRNADVLQLPDGRRLLFSFSHRWLGGDIRALIEAVQTR